MRKVNIPVGATPPDDWLQDAQKVTESLYAAQTEEERNAIIEKKEKLWRDPRIRDWLLSLFHNKCWYTEAKESVSAIHVDHYRPKGRVTDLDKNQRDGYWWLAFDWTNYRICGQLINVKKKDLFPLSGVLLATPDKSIPIEYEETVVIDPRTDDARLISFEMDEDGCIVVPISDADEDEKQRVNVTIDVLGLNRLDRLNQNRSDIWNECRSSIADYTSAVGLPHALKLVHQGLAITKLKELTDYKKEFSSVADACIRKTANEVVQAKVRG